MSQIYLYAWYLKMAATGVLLARLISNGLFPIYRWFAFYLLADFAQSLLSLYFRPTNDQNANRYAETYMAGQALKMVLIVFVLLEMYRLALSNHRAIARFGGQTIGYALLLTALVAGLFLNVARSAPRGRSLILHRFYLVERTVDVWALALLCLITAFLLWFPVKLRRNSVLYLLGFFVYFAARSASLLLVDLLPARDLSAISTAVLLVSLLCLIVWIVALRRDANDTVTVVGHRWDPSAAERLSAQLNAINASLLRLSRR